MPFNCIEGYSKTRFNNYGNKMLTEIHDLFCSMSKEILRIKNFEDFMLVRIFIKVKSGSIKNINANLRDFFNINHINDREKNIVIKRAEGYTLEKLGRIYGVQRERIRQIEAKTLNKLKKIFKSSNFINYLHNKKKVDLTINETIIDDDYYKIFICRLDEIAEYKKVEINGKIFFYDFILYKSAENLFKNLLASIKLNGYVSYDMIENLSVDQNLLDYFILKNNLEVVNGLLTTKSNKREKMALYLKQNLIIDISNNNVRNIMKDLETNYDLMFDSERAFIGILNAVSYSIGSGKYTSLDNDPIIPKEIMELIINDIKTKKFIKTEVLYENYKGKIINLLSPTHLYLYIKKKYPNEYNYGGTNLVISTKGTKTSQSSRVYEYLQNVAEPVKRDDLRMMFGLDSVAMNVIEQQNDDIIKYGKNKYFLRGKLFASKENIDLISKYICGMKSFLVNDLYKYCLIKKLSIINDNFITSVEEFTSFCCNLKLNIFDDFILNKDNYRFERIEDENNLNADDLEFELDL